MESAAPLIQPGDDRWKTYGDLEGAINDDMPWAFVFYGHNFFYRSARVANLNPQPTYGLSFENATASS